MVCGATHLNPTPPAWLTARDIVAGIQGGGGRKAGGAGAHRCRVGVR